MGDGCSDAFRDQIISIHDSSSEVVTDSVVTSDIAISESEVGGHVVNSVNNAMEETGNATSTGTESRENYGYDPKYKHLGSGNGTDIATDIDNPLASWLRKNPQTDVWVLTFNNSQEPDRRDTLLQLIEQLKQICIEFHGAEEYGEESHLPHVHIAFKTVGRKTYRSLWNILRKFECWFEPAKNFKKAVIYATKGERDEKFKSEYESGKFRAFHLGEMAADKTGQRRNETNDLLFLIRDKMASGEWDEDTIANLYPQIFQRYNKVIIQFTVERSRMVVYNECKQNAFARRDLTVWWFYGREGSGKSMRARQELFNYCCQQNPNNGFFVQSSFKWVNGYKSGMPVLIDDFRAGNLASAGYQLDHLLKVLDAYSFLREIKNGFTIWNPPLIIITSFFDPVESFKDTRNPNETVNLARMESLGQLVRRLNLIVEFDRKVVTNSEQGGEVFVEQFVQRDRTKYFYDMFELVPRPGKVVPLLFGGEARGANE